MNYQVGTEANVIKLNVGDVIRDDSLNASCTVDSIEDNVLHVSKVCYSHPYILTRFSLNLFEFMKKSLGVRKISLKTNLGSFTVDNEASENELYHRLVRVWN